MADAGMLKTWVVRTFFKIPLWYVLTQVEEERLFNYIISEQWNASMARFLDCTTICDDRLCYFCSDESPLCRHCTRYSRSN